MSGGQKAMLIAGLAMAGGILAATAAGGGKGGGLDGRDAVWLFGFIVLIAVMAWASRRL